MRLALSTRNSFFQKYYFEMEVFYNKINKQLDCFYQCHISKLDKEWSWFFACSRDNITPLVMPERHFTRVTAWSWLECKLYMLFGFVSRFWVQFRIKRIIPQNFVYEKFSALNIVLLFFIMIFALLLKKLEIIPFEQLPGTSKAPLINKRIQNVKTCSILTEFHFLINKCHLDTQKINKIPYTQNVTNVQ